MSWLVYKCTSDGGSGGGSGIGGYDDDDDDGFVTAILDQVISSYSLKDLDFTNRICRKCRQKVETIQHINGTCSDRHNQVSNIFIKN